MKKIYLLALVVLGFSANSFGQVSATATATAAATIISPIKIVWVADMNFGDVAAGAGTVILSPGGARLESGAVELPVTTGTVSAASFTVSGTEGYLFNVTLPTGILALTSAVDLTTMDVTDFTSNLNANQGTFDSSGETALQVGATLNVTALQTAGQYVSVPFTVTVAYN